MTNEKLKHNFQIVRKNVLANPSLYGGRYTQKNIDKAYIEWLEDLLLVAIKEV